MAEERRQGRVLDRRRRGAAPHRRRNLYRPAPGARDRGTQGAAAAAIQARSRDLGHITHAGRKLRARIQNVMSRADAVTRILFEAFGAAEVRLFYLLGYAAIAVFGYGVYVQIRKYRRGAALQLDGSFQARLGDMIGKVLSHRTIARRDPAAGAAHRLIF